MYKLSIIIPHYQSFNLLTSCLNSIPIDDSIQIIVVDDKSSSWDEYEQKLKSVYPHVTFVEMTLNGGAGAARNVGLRMVQGEWLMFADADDYFLPNAFNIIKQCFGSDADVIYFQVVSIDLVKGEVATRHQHHNSYIEDFESLKPNSEENLRYRCYPPWGKMIRTKIVTTNRIQFDEVKYSNDVMFSAKVGYYADKIEVIKQPIYCITASMNSLTRQMNANVIMCRYNVALDFNSFLKCVGKSNCQLILLRYFVLAIKYVPSCIIPMIRIAIKRKANLLAGLHRWKLMFKRK